MKSSGLLSPVASARIEGEKVKGWFTNVLLALCIFGLAAAWVTYRDAGMRQDLKRYDLDTFKQTEWIELKVQVEVQSKLIEAYGLQKAVRDAVNETIKEQANGRTYHHSTRRKKRSHGATGLGGPNDEDTKRLEADLLQR